MLKLLRTDPPILGRGDEGANAWERKYERDCNLHFKKFELTDSENNIGVIATKK